MTGITYSEPRTLNAERVSHPAVKRGLLRVPCIFCGYLARDEDSPNETPEECPVDSNEGTPNRV